MDGTYSPFELSRYLDYCSEMLALISKIAVLYVQDLTDPVAIDTVDDVEDLTTGLSRKIWQKLTVLYAMPPVEAAPQADSAPAPAPAAPAAEAPRQGAAPPV